jgi:hypothetical protein
VPLPALGHRRLLDHPLHLGDQPAPADQPDPALPQRHQHQEDLAGPPPLEVPAHHRFRRSLRDQLRPAGLARRLVLPDLADPDCLVPRLDLAGLELLARRPLPAGRDRLGAPVGLARLVRLAALLRPAAPVRPPHPAGRQVLVNPQRRPVLEDQPHLADPAALARQAARRCRQVLYARCGVHPRPAGPPRPVRRR